MNPDLVVPDDDGKIITVRYEAVKAMLLNEFLKEHKRINQQEHKMQEQAAMVSKSDLLWRSRRRLLHSSGSRSKPYCGLQKVVPSRPQQTCTIVGCESCAARLPNCINPDTVAVISLTANPDTVLPTSRRLGISLPGRIAALSIYFPEQPNAYSCRREVSSSLLMSNQSKTFRR